MKIKFFVYNLIAFLLLASCGKTAKLESYSIIPQPVSMKVTKDTFKYSSATKICLEGLGRNSNSVTILSQSLRKIHIKPRYAGSRTKRCLVLKMLPASAMEHPDEYMIHIGDSGIVIAAASEPGLFYGIQTFLQMLPPDMFKLRYSSVELPYCDITDYPRYQWRGLRIDFKVNKFSVSDLERYVSVMALYKLNRLHIRLDGLVEDNGTQVLSYAELCELEYIADNNYVKLVVECDSCDPESLIDLSSIRPVEADKLISTSETQLRRGYRFDPFIETEEGGGLFQVDSAKSKVEFEYRLFPAVCAFAESVWSPRAAKQWPDFRRRIEHHKLLLENMDFSYNLGSFKPVVRWLCSDSGEWKALLESEVYGAQIHYTVDGMEPTLHSPVAHGAVDVPEGAELKTLVEYRNLIRDSIYTFSH